MSYTEYFSIIDAGEGRWLVRHRYTDELAGLIARTRSGFVLSDDNHRSLGTFSTMDDALRGLYAFA